MKNNFANSFVHFPRTDFLKAHLPKHFVSEGKSCFLMTEDENFEDFRNLDFKGTFLGEQVKNNFVPSLMLLESMSDKFGKLFVDDKAEWLFCCGRDILDSGITKLRPLKHSEKFKDMFLVYDKNKYVLGLAKKDLDSKDRTVFRNYFDAGYYLRREMN